MKTLIAFIAMAAFMSNAVAQSTKDVIKQQVGDGVKQGAAIATEHTADKVADKVLNSIFGRKKKKKNDNQSQNTSVNNNNNNNVATNTSATNGLTTTDSSGTSLQTYSKYDFVPGEKVLVYEDFSKDAIGDFPVNWNTNSAGEIVTASRQTGQWLMLNKKGIYRQDDVTTLPDNFTYEYDMMYSGDNDFLRLFLVSGGDDNGRLAYDMGNRSGVDIGIQTLTRGDGNGGVAHISTYNDGNTIIDNQVEFHNTSGVPKLKISVWRQQQRLRVYINQDKVFDLPRAFAAGKVYNTAMFQLWSDPNNSQSKYLISNIKLAAGAPDTRNKLINEGKFSTTGILFDVNSANIKPESYGSLKEIADVLQENANVRVKIIGHTDNDGDASMNLALSKKRAETVKSFLQSEFNIDGTRMETDGKGASEPVGDNKTAAGKAQNRRVEFLKI
ncbi:MAG: OmpA family protein [Bacteroidetes bacterium]|nr:OmpA family protein [Bacteroidota bacterium]MBS1929823.1 OmpA family protein [Bacteroidota bacterium]